MIGTIVDAEQNLYISSAGVRLYSPDLLNHSTMRQKKIQLDSENPELETPEAVGVKDSRSISSPTRVLATTNYSPHGDCHFQIEQSVMNIRHAPPSSGAVLSRKESRPSACQDPTTTATPGSFSIEAPHSEYKPVTSQDSSPHRPAVGESLLQPIRTARVLR